MFDLNSTQDFETDQGRDGNPYSFFAVLSDLMGRRLLDTDPDVACRVSVHDAGCRPFELHRAPWVLTEVLGVGSPTVGARKSRSGVLVTLTLARLGAQPRDGTWSSSIHSTSPGGESTFSGNLREDLPAVRFGRMEVRSGGVMHIVWNDGTIQRRWGKGRAADGSAVGRRQATDQYGFIRSHNVRVLHNSPPVDEHEAGNTATRAPSDSSGRWTKTDCRNCIHQAFSFQSETEAAVTSLRAGEEIIVFAGDSPRSGSDGSTGPGFYERCSLYKVPSGEFLSTPVWQDSDRSLALLQQTAVPLLQGWSVESSGSSTRTGDLPSAQEWAKAVTGRVAGADDPFGAQSKWVSARVVSRPMTFVRDCSIIH